METIFLYIYVSVSQSVGVIIYTYIIITALKSCTRRMKRHALGSDFHLTAAARPQHRCTATRRQVSDGRINTRGRDPQSNNSVRPRRLSLTGLCRRGLLALDRLGLSWRTVQRCPPAGKLAVLSPAGEDCWRSSERLVADCAVLSSCG